MCSSDLANQVAVAAPCGPVAGGTVGGHGLDGAVEGVPVLSMDRDHPREVVLDALPRILPPVVRGLAGAVDELVFDLGRDAQVLSVALPLVDFLYVVVGAGLSSLAAASVCVPRAAVACAETFVVLPKQPQVRNIQKKPILFLNPEKIH